MIERLKHVLIDQLGFAVSDAQALTEALAGYARMGPSVTLGGVGVIPIQDIEDRHVLETAWAGGSDVMVTANIQDFLFAVTEILRPGRLHRLRRGGNEMILAHPFDAHWLRVGEWPHVDGA
jgi:hypothetical protein